MYKSVTEEQCDLLTSKAKIRKLFKHMMSADQPLVKRLAIKIGDTNASKPIFMMSLTKKGVDYVNHFEAVASKIVNQA